MPENCTPLIASSNLIHHCARAKYIPQPDGSMKLAAVQYFDQPRFVENGWEKVDNFQKKTEKAVSSEKKADPRDIARASRRAKIRAFDTILCNPDLDTFATFTYRPDESLDKASYAECYEVLRPWLSNRVQRRGLRYVIVPELHKSGDIHFHGIMNSASLNLCPAISPKTGKPLSRNGLPLLNVTDWKAGFSTAQIIGSAEADRDKVAKYIFKYMGKQCGSRIGGRYALIGGADLVQPMYVYGDSVEELVGHSEAKWSRTVQVSDHLEYRELTFI